MCDVGADDDDDDNNRAIDQNNQRNTQHNDVFIWNVNVRAEDIHIFFC